MPNQIILERGILNTYDPIKGYGFIRRERGKDVFAFFAEFDCKTGDTGALLGSIVEFQIEERGDKLRAKKIKIIG